MDGLVYVGGNNGNIYALAAATGKKKWSYSTGEQVFSSPAVVGGTVYAGSANGTIYALNADTGALQWSHPTGKAVYSSPRGMCRSPGVLPGLAMSMSTGASCRPSTGSGRTWSSITRDRPDQSRRSTGLRSPAFSVKSR